jgi:hypothetical protein
MSMEVLDSKYSSNGDNEARDTMYLLGGVALVIFGAGLILSNSTVRRYLGDVGVGDLLSAAVPDLEKYMKLRGM